MSSDLSPKCSLLILKVKMFMAYKSESSYICFWFFFYAIHKVKIWENAMGKPVWAQNILTKCTPKASQERLASSLCVSGATEVGNVCDLAHRCLLCWQKCWQAEGLLLLHFQSCSEWWQSFTLGEGKEVESSGNNSWSLTSICLPKGCTLTQCET